MLKVKGRKLESGKKSCIYVESAPVHDLASITAESAIEGNWEPSFCFYLFLFGGNFSPFGDFFLQKNKYFVKCFIFPKRKSAKNSKFKF
jgi:hypothetical protein